MTLSALETLVRGLQSMPGRKPVLYFTSGLYVTPELDVPFRNVMSQANRANVTFYTLDTRGVMVSALAAVLIGGAPHIISFFLSQGNGILS